MFFAHRPTVFQTLRNTVIRELSKGSDPNEVIQWARDYDIEDTFIQGMVGEIVAKIKLQNRGMTIEWAPDLGTNVDLHALQVNTSSKIDVTTNLAYKKTMLMSNRISVCQQVWFAEVRFAEDAFIGSSRAQVLMNEPLDKMLAAVDIEILSSEDLMELDVFNQLVWELSPTLGCPLINKRMKRLFERHYHREIKQGLISRQAIERMLTDCCYSVYSHIRSHGKNRCFTELEVHAYLDRTFAKQWGVEEEWGVLSKLVDYEAKIQLSAHIANKPSIPRKVRNA